MRPKYFLPWWPSDYVWHEWRIDHDLERRPGWSKAYFWDYFPGALNGILVSRMAVPKSRIAELRKAIHFEGIILGDSGAHSYRALDKPPFSCQDLLEFYAAGRFDLGMALDIVASPLVRKGGLNLVELWRRWKLNLANAEQCLELHRKYSYPFELLGVVQGWNLESYFLCAAELLKIGYTQLAIAGQRKLSLLQEVIFAIKATLTAQQKEVRLHVLGTGDPRILNFYIESGIDSFDSSTWLRKSWLSAQHNYFVVQDKRYIAFRATRVGLGTLDEQDLKWSTLVHCQCPLCKTLGQQILLFRGHERNTRRGFHNVWQYTQLLKAQKNQV